VKASKSPRVSEKEVAAYCDDLARQLGFGVQRYEQGRATMITEGLPDRRYVHADRSERLWSEIKAPDGKLTAAQYNWLLDEIHAGGHACVVLSATQLAQIFDLIRVRDPALVKTSLLRCLEAFAERGFRRTSPKPPRRARLPR
jgi:hypothetical protein